MGHQCNLCAGRSTNRRSRLASWPNPSQSQSQSSPEFSLRDFTFWLIRIICLDYFDIGVWPIRLWFLPAKSGLLLSLYNWFISEKHNNYIHYICIIKICIICRNTPYVLYAKQKRSQLGIRFVFFVFCLLGVSSLNVSQGAGKIPVEL